MRLPSVIANAATGWLVAAVALRLFSPPTGGRQRPAGGRQPAACYWGQDARGYAWLVALSVGSFLALVAIRGRQPAGRPRDEPSPATY